MLSKGGEGQFPVGNPPFFSPLAEVEPNGRSPQAHARMHVGGDELGIKLRRMFEIRNQATRSRNQISPARCNPRHGPNSNPSDS